MENSNRRMALRQMLFFSLGGAALLHSCKSQKSAAAAPSAPAGTVAPTPATTKTSAELLVRAGTVSLPADGTVAGAPKIRSEHTNGQFCCQEITVQSHHAGPPPHMHNELDEMMYVIEGTVQVLVGDHVTEVNGGDYHLRPHGVVHTFWNSGDAPARFIDMYPNQDFVSYFEDFSRIIGKLKTKGLAPDSPEALKMFGELDKKFGVEIYFDQFPALLEKYNLKPSF